MSSAGKSWSKAGVVCPRPGHGGSRVRFAGRHGPPRHRRQRYMCVPASADRPHRFTEPLPRDRQRSARPVEMPLSTSPLDGFINPIRAAIGPRAYGLKNRERTNRLLMLMQLHANRQDDDNDYVRLIRASLEANHGRPNVARRAVVNLGRIASLR